MSNVREITGPQQFRDVISDPEQAALVDFWAEWCGPCKMLSPVIERLAKEYDGRMRFTKLNVDEFPEISQRYGVKSIPTTIIFRQGQPATRITGFKPAGALRPHLDRYALPAPEGETATKEVEPSGGGLLGGIRRLFGS